MKAITNVTAYPLPGFTAAHGGQPVTVIAMGEQEGSSPVLQFIDRNNKVNWAPLGAFTVLETNLLPPSKESIENALKSLISATK